MKRQFHTLILCALCLSVRSQAQQAPAASGSVAPNPVEAPARVVAAPADAQRESREFAWILNEKRAGLPPMKCQNSLQAAANWLTQDMAGNNYTAHTDSLGRAFDSRIADYYGSGHRTAEIITAQQTTFAQAVEYWMNSPEHRANILSAAFNEFGLSRSSSDSSEHTNYWAVDFGSRDENFPLVINREKPDTNSTEVDLYIYGAGWAKRMRLSNDGARWSDWMPYAATLKWNLLPGSGPRTVYVEMENRYGVSRKDQDTINLLPPTTLSKK